jgi:putative intracellular protease/amidase/mannose/cellobiose epimerase-like protein (N-acyl-D-glucosamine 2-epimerase family)
MFRRFANQLTVTGLVRDISPDGAWIGVRARSGDEFQAFMGPETQFSVLQNLDEQSNDPFRNDEERPRDPRNFLSPGQLVIVEGMLLEDDHRQRFDCRTVHVLYNSEGRLLFEAPHWWINQMEHLCDQIMGTMWRDGESFDYSLYRTNIGISGIPSTDGLQEIETLGRLVYGFATAYLLTGNDRYLDAAREGVVFQRKWFRSLTHDGRHLIWRSWKVGNETGLGSRNGDDGGAIAAYEQIYALAGLTQYYRVTLEPEALLDIRRTIESFDRFFLDPSERDGYYSHLDPSTMTPDAEVLGPNRAKKNWNSTGDHIPAYLVNLLIALKPLAHRPTTADLQAFVDRCERLLRRCATLILKHFPDPDESVPYVRERFHADWTPDLTYGWQKDRAVCGHNLKIAWNLTRLANHYESTDRPFAAALRSRAETIARRMATAGLDTVRGGVLDCVERRPANGMFVDFTWWNTRDFWQQEQGILAYLILYGSTQSQEFLELAEETMAYWNAFFLDHDTGGIYFRTDGNGAPVLVGPGYRNQTGHAKSGYHCFELAYLAHVYLCTFVTSKGFSLNFRPEVGCGQRSINVLPDFLPPGFVRIRRININGVDRDNVEAADFKLELDEEDFGSHVIVEFEPALKPAEARAADEAYAARPLAGKKVAIVLESQYIPAELEIFTRHFEANGAEVHLVSRLWGKTSLTFYSTVEPGVQDALEWQEVTHDFEKVRPEDYAAVIVAANYVSVRLRWSERDDVTAENAAEVAHDVPAARFLEAAMRNPSIIKGLPCHALWLLTPSPNVLAGRRVLCNKVVLSDVLNAGGIYTPCPDDTPEDRRVVVDGDLVTSDSWHASAEMARMITDLIVAGARPPAWVPTSVKSLAIQAAARMAASTFVTDQPSRGAIPTEEVSRLMADGCYDRTRLCADARAKLGVGDLGRPGPDDYVLMVVADHGVWGSEVTLAMKVLQAAGYSVKVATLSGRAPMFVPSSLNQSFVDRTWGAGWVAPGEADLAWRVQKELLELEKRGKILKLDGLIPARPQALAGSAGRDDYERKLRTGLETLGGACGVIVPGGTGAIIDLADNSQLEAILMMVHQGGFPVMGICYGILSLLSADDGRMVKGLSLTAHNRADDFVTGTAALTDEGLQLLRGYAENDDLAGYISDARVRTTEWRSPTRKEEVEAEAYGGPGVHVISPYTPDSCAVYDNSKAIQGVGPVITGRSIHCGFDAALAMVAHLLGSEALAPVLMMTGTEPARVPTFGDYNRNRPGRR